MAKWLLLAASALVVACVEKPQPPTPTPPPVSARPSFIVGEIRAFAIPTGNRVAISRLKAAGWMPADGRSLNRIAYPELHDAIGFTWGTADGSNVFNAPDLRGLFLRGWDGEAGRDPDGQQGRRVALRPGGAAGDGVGTLEQDAFQTHKHLDRGHDHGLRGYQNGTHIAPGFDQGTPNFPARTALGEANIGGPTTLESHSAVRTSEETRPKNVAVIYFVFAGRSVS